METIEEVAGTIFPKEESIYPWKALAQERKAVIEAVHLTRHNRGKIIWLLYESLHELLRDHPYTLEALYLLSNLMPSEKYVKNGVHYRMEFIYTIKGTTSKLWGINAVKLTLGLEQLQILKRVLSRSYREYRILFEDAAEYIEKSHFI